MNPASLFQNSTPGDMMDFWRNLDGLFSPTDVKTFNAEPEARQAMVDAFHEYLRQTGPKLGDPLQLESMPFERRIGTHLYRSEVVERGRYDFVSPHFSSLKNSDPQAHVVRLVSFPTPMDTQAVLDQLQRIHMRPVGADELAALGTDYPDLGRARPIVALDSYLTGFGNPVLSGRADRRQLAVRFIPHQGWSTHTQFIAAKAA